MKILKNILKNKKASTLQNWTEGIIISVLFIIVLGIIVVGMNNLYSKNYTLAGLPTSGIQDKAEEYQESLSQKVKGGEVSFLGALGMTLTTSWDIITSTVTLIWGFLAGGWIHTIVVDYMRMPVVVALFIRMIYFISIGFIILKILFRVKA